eukprot:m.28105 g.28105  ORF g.28105 m.28105 type:complete len:309 (-) comp4499_c0_seq2:986-1912(-)
MTVTLGAAPSRGIRQRLGDVGDQLVAELLGVGCHLDNREGLGPAEHLDGKRVDTRALGARDLADDCGRLRRNVRRGMDRLLPARVVNAVAAQHGALQHRAAAHPVAGQLGVGLLEEGDVRVKEDWRGGARDGQRQAQRRADRHRLRTVHDHLDDARRLEDPRVAQRQGSDLSKLANRPCRCGLLAGRLGHDRLVHAVAVAVAGEALEQPTRGVLLQRVRNRVSELNGFPLRRCDHGHVRLALVVDAASKDADVQLGARCDVLKDKGLLEENLVNAVGAGDGVQAGMADLLADPQKHKAVVDRPLALGD